MTDPVPKLILAFVADLYFATRIESTAGRLGCQVRFIERPAQVLPDPGPGGPEDASPGWLLDLMRARRPALLIFDLNNAEIPWGDWIPAVRADTDLGAVPVVAFGSHVETDTLAHARAAGAQPVLARSRFVSGLPEILAKALGG